MRRGRDRALLALEDQLGQRPGVDRCATGQELIEDDAERVDVSCARDRLAARLFGGDVGGGAEHRADLGMARGGERACDAEVCDLHLPVSEAEDVLWLDVPVHEPLGVGGLERRAQLDRDRDDLRRWERAASFDVLCKRASVHVFHDDVGATPVLADVIDLNDVRVDEPRGQPRFAQESLPEGFVIGELQREDLEGDWAFEHAVAGEVDGCHPAAAEDPFNHETLGGRSTIETLVRHGVRTPDHVAAHGKASRPSRQLTPGGRDRCTPVQSCSLT